MDEDTQNARFSRRALLGGTASLIVGVAATLSIWRTGSSATPLMRAYRSAQKNGKPLLARIRSEEPRELEAVNAERREAFSDLYSEGAIQELAPLSLCDTTEIAFAEIAAQLHLSPLARGLELVLIETAGREPAGVFFAPILHIEMPETPTRTGLLCANSRVEREQLRKQRELADSAAAEQASAYRLAQRPLRTRRLAQALVASLTPNTAALERRAKQNADALAEPERRAVAQAVAQRAVPPPLLCERAAAVIALAAARTSDVAFRELLVRELAAAARRRASTSATAEA